ncbi:hypothetical protein KO465_06335, partial [Candidatus Micrarchaeota archaeon]|nr:hypothetical protein [Candidatus Micrarchaeota archaeon]
KVNRRGRRSGEGSGVKVNRVIVSVPDLHNKNRRRPGMDLESFARDYIYLLFKLREQDRSLSERAIEYFF